MKPGLPQPAIVIPLVYCGLTLGIGWLARRRAVNTTANEYLNASRSIALPLVTAAYLASNCGSLELVGMSAMASHAGVQALHFFWIGAIPAMIFVALFLMPIYRRSGIRSVPEYLERRFGRRLRRLNAAVSALAVLLLSGISLYAMAQVLSVLLSIGFGTSIVVCAAVVLAYVLLGGVRATIYNEVLQLAVIVAGLAPLSIFALRHRLISLAPARPPALHLWTSLPLFNRHAPLDVFGVVFGLGLILSFSYWCTDFVLMQRAFTARTEDAARQVPLWAGFGKLIFSFLIVIPGLLVFTRSGAGWQPDQGLPLIMKATYGPMMLGVGMTALAASLMSGLAANITAFGALWTEDLYRPWLRRGLTEAHYLAVGKLSMIAAMAIALATSYLNFLFNDLMEHVQLIFSVVGAPFWAIFLLGFFSRRADERGALAGFSAGAATAFLHSLLARAGWAGYGSTMTSNFYSAIYAFTVSLVTCWLVSRGRTTEAAAGFTWSSPDDAVHTPASLWVLAGCLLASCLALNFIWR